MPARSNSNCNDTDAAEVGAVTATAAATARARRRPRATDATDSFLCAAQDGDCRRLATLLQKGQSAESTREVRARLLVREQRTCRRFVNRASHPLALNEPRSAAAWLHCAHARRESRPRRLLGAQLTRPQPGLEARSDTGVRMLTHVAPRPEQPLVHNRASTCHRLEPRWSVPHCC